MKTTAKLILLIIIIIFFKGCAFWDKIDTNTTKCPAPNISTLKANNDYSAIYIGWSHISGVTAYKYDLKVNDQPFKSSITSDTLLIIPYEGEKITKLLLITASLCGKLIESPMDSLSRKLTDPVNVATVAIVYPRESNNYYSPCGDEYNKCDYVEYNSTYRGTGGAGQYYKSTKFCDCDKYEKDGKFGQCLGSPIQLRANIVTCQ